MAHRISAQTLALILAAYVSFLLCNPLLLSTCPQFLTAHWRALREQVRGLASHMKNLLCQWDIQMEISNRDFKILF